MGMECGVVVLELATSVDLKSFHIRYSIVLNYYAPPSRYRDDIDVSEEKE